ncbi:hypothetical protein [Desulfobulbus elongatus]|uniref:hypothetical protein n=1 Tax=Desulfobulbus elongatus TaxID=53332 RepID=UPI0004850FF3|nr:hypothetical protein [Desulfobulbus elongatus]
MSALRGAIGRHLRKHLVIYVPAAAPLIFVLLAHGITVATLVLIRSGVLPQGLGLHKTLVTWGVYGFLPLLLCSYGCFFAVARPVTGLLTRRYPEWPPAGLTVVSGAAYGAAVALVLLLLLAPGSTLRVFFLLLIGMATGLGNWWLYRALTVAPPQTAQPPRAGL